MLMMASDWARVSWVLVSTVGLPSLQLAGTLPPVDSGNVSYGEKSSPSCKRSLGEPS